MRIELEQVAYVYQPGSISAAAALHDIDLSVSQGEMVAVIGHGGSGKSTLALLLAGLYQPTSGLVRITDQERRGEELFRKVGLVFQYPEQQLFGESVFEEVAFGAKNFGTPVDFLPTKVRAALEEVGLDANTFWHRSPFALSGGQKRRVAIASVLAANPRIIIFDEPTAGLDAGGRRWIINLAQKLHKQRKGIVWITHNMAEAALAERLIVLNQGGILLDGPPREVFSHEDLLTRAGLDIPQAAHVVRSLKSRGVSLPGQAVSVDEAYREISDWLAGRPPQSADAAEPLAAAAAESAPPIAADASCPELELAAELAPARDSLPAAENAPHSGAPEELDEAWERQAVRELKALIQDNEPETAVIEPEATEITPDFDLAGFTGEESPVVPEWRGGEADV